MVDVVDSTIKQFVLSMARSAQASGGPAVLSVENIIAKCGGSGQIAQHVLANLEAQRVIRVERSDNSEYFDVYLTNG